MESMGLKVNTIDFLTFSGTTKILKDLCNANEMLNSWIYT